jgi:hypothetical protein
MRKKFVSKWAKVNTLELVADRIKPVSKQGSWMLDRMLKASAGLASLVHGNANREHMNDIVACHNMTWALQRHRVGEDYDAMTDASEKAIRGITDRFKTLGRYVATGPEIKALQDILELHQAQLDICTVGQVDEAYEYAKRTQTTTSKLNTHFIGDWE